MLTNIVNIQPKDSGGGGGETRETVVYRLCDDMIEKLPEDYKEYEVCIYCHILDLKNMTFDVELSVVF